MNYLSSTLFFNKKKIYFCGKFLYIGHFSTHSLIISAHVESRKTKQKKRLSLARVKNSLLAVNILAKLEISSVNYPK